MNDTVMTDGGAADVAAPEVAVDVQAAVPQGGDGVGQPPAGGLADGAASDGGAQAVPQGVDDAGQPAAGGPAEDMRRAYAFDEPEVAGQDGGGEDASAGEGAEAPYAVEYPEGFVVDPVFADIVAPIARESGVEGKVFGALTARVVGAMQEAEYANMVKTDAELKADWGADYHANMKVAKATAERLMQGSGLSRQDLAVLQSPKGMRLLYAVSQMTGERAAAGVAKASASESSWASEVMTNPQHPDYADFRDPSSPRWRQLNERYNRAQLSM